MSAEQHFLIKYGIHNFVTCMKNGVHPSFVINKSEHRSMVSHAKKLIQGAYGDTTEIRVA